MTTFSGSTDEGPVRLKQAIAYGAPFTIVVVLAYLLDYPALGLVAPVVGLLGFMIYRNSARV
jgi:hypothetical protein